MNTWRIYPVIDEINSWVWLSELSRTQRRPARVETYAVFAWNQGSFE